MPASVTDLDRKFHQSLVQIFGQGPVAGVAYDVVVKAIHRVVSDFANDFNRQHLVYRHQSEKLQTREGEIYEEAVSQSIESALEFVSVMLPRVPRHLERLDTHAAPVCPPLTNRDAADSDAALVLGLLSEWKSDREEQEAEEESYEFARVALGRAKLHGFSAKMIKDLKNRMEIVLAARFQARRKRQIRQIFLPRQSDSVETWFRASFKHTRRDLRSVVRKQSRSHVSISAVAEPKSEQTADAEVREAEREAEHERLLLITRAQTESLSDVERFVQTVTYSDDLPVSVRDAASCLRGLSNRRDVMRRAKSVPTIMRKCAAKNDKDKARRRYVLAVLAHVLDRSERQVRRYQERVLDRHRDGLRATGNLS